VRASITLRTLADTVSGLYIDERAGRYYRREDVLHLPTAILDIKIRLDRLEPGTYCVYPADPEAPTFRLHSRRRGHRNNHAPGTSPHPLHFDDTGT
jgi:hypothetical protein